jgi:hypothetical protein
MSCQVADGPRTERFEFQNFPITPGCDVEFRLVYRGLLPAEGKGSSRGSEKNAIRRQFHPQLKTLWQDNAALSRVGDEWAPEFPNTTPQYKSALERIAGQYERCGYGFIPLINKEWGIGLSLDILFLRRDQPGGLVKSGGDIDNRIKVLMDGLRMPQVRNEIPELLQPDENPFYCLMEDDSLITDISITTDRLLLPRQDEEKIHEVLLVIAVKTRVIDGTRIPLFLDGLA